MKMKWLLMVAVAALLVVADRARAEELAVITGSHIPKEIQPAGRTAASVAPVLIMNRTSIDRSGSSTVGGVLRRVPFAQVRGH
jgi:hypothetical protein